MPGSAYRADRRAARSRLLGPLIAVVAFAATAVLAVALSRPLDDVLSRPRLHPALLANACTTADIHTWLGMSASPHPVLGDRSTYYTLEFTNVSRRTCVLDGYPGVAAYTGRHQIGSAATLDTAIRPSAVTLAPGATAHATLTATGGPGTATCREVTAPELRIYLPHILTADLVPWRGPACSRQGARFLSVAPVEARPGIPGAPQY
jgi:hypothetical protein